MGFLDFVLPNPPVQTAATYARSFHKRFHPHWEVFEEMMSFAFLECLEQRLPMKKLHPSEHRQFCMDCCDNKFTTVTDFVLEILRIEIYHGHIPSHQRAEITHTIKKTLLRNGLPQRFI